VAGVDVVTVGPLYGDQVPGGMQFSVFAIVPNRDGKDFSTSYLTLDIGQDPFMAAVYRTALIIALEEFFGRVQIFSDELTLAKYCQEWRVAQAAHRRLVATGKARARAEGGRARDTGLDARPVWKRVLATELLT
jgi:hypothetical protein